jgi:hypothetical protein
VLEDELVVADAGPLVDRPLDGVLGDALPLGLLDGHEQPGVHRRVGPAALGGQRDVAEELGVGLGPLGPGDHPFRVQPLASHRARHVQIGWRPHLCPPCPSEMMPSPDDDQRKLVAKGVRN